MKSRIGKKHNGQREIGEGGGEGKNGDRTDLSPFGRVVAPTGGAYPSFLRVISALYRIYQLVSHSAEREDNSREPHWARQAQMGANVTSGK